MGGDFFIQIGGMGGSGLAEYTAGFKSRMIERMAGAEGISATALSREMGISQSTLSRWLRGAGIVESMKKKQGTHRARSPRQWTAEEKLRVVLATAELTGEELGAYLRQEGLHQAQLDRWRSAVAEALSGPDKQKRKAALKEARKIKTLERELRRKDKALAEVTALLVLKKSWKHLWGTGTKAPPRGKGHDSGPHTGSP